MMTEKEFNAFKYEIINWGNIPISSQNCGIGCRFCKVHKDPILKRFSKIPRITKEELTKGFQLINEKHNYVRLGAGVFVAPHTDPFLHPEIYDFIKIASDYFPKKRIRTVTTGSYIEENKVEYLNSIKNFGIDLSLITMQKQRELLVPRTTRNRIEYLLKNAPLKKISLMFTGNFDELEKDIEKLHELNWHINGQEILIRRIEHTNLSDTLLYEISNNSINKYEKCAEFLKSKYPNVKFTVPYLDSVFIGGDNEYFIDAKIRIENIIKFAVKYPNKKISVLCPSSSFSYFKDKLKETEIEVNLIKNYLYGGSVTVAGLLNHQDIINQYSPKCKVDIIILPFEMYDTDNNEITGRNMNELANHYKCKIYKL